METRALRVTVVAAVLTAVGSGTSSFITEGRAGANQAADTLRVAFATSFSTPDPALNLNIYFGQIEYATCAKLLNYPDKAGAAGTRLVPEVAETLPRVSRDDRTYTFTIRRGFRFNTGVEVTAAHFAGALNRILNPMVKSPAAGYFEDIEGAQEVLQGRARIPTGIRVRGRNLIIRLNRRAPDFPHRMAMRYVCAVPVDYPAETNTQVVPAGAGPYYIAEWVPGRTVVLRQNPFYGGARPRHFSEVVYKLNVPLDTLALQAERGETDYAIVGPIDYARLRDTYGVNKRQLFVQPSLRMGLIALNTDRPLFRNNPWLRQAVNFAIDRRALVATLGGISGKRTDQYLSPSMPGYTDADIYPLRGPNLAKARALARGHLRDAKAVLYTANASSTALSRAQIIQYNLRQIGLDVEIMVTPQPEPPFIRARGAPFDLKDDPGGASEYPDPYAALNRFFDGRFLRAENNTNLSFFNDPTFNRKLAAAARLSGPARYRAYGKLDVGLARDAAPAVAYSANNWVAFFSSRIGCVTINPISGVSLGALCSR